MRKHAAGQSHRGTHCRCDRCSEIGLKRGFKLRAAKAGERPAVKCPKILLRVPTGALGVCLGIGIAAYLKFAVTLIVCDLLTTPPDQPNHGDPAAGATMKLRTARCEPMPATRRMKKAPSSFTEVHSSGWSSAGLFRGALGANRRGGGEQSEGEFLEQGNNFAEKTPASARAWAFRSA